MDFPQGPRPLFLHTYTHFAPILPARLLASMGCATITWVANLAVYVPVYVPFPYQVNRVFWVNGSIVTGNSNFGIFASNGKLIYSTGSTAQAGAQIPQFVTPTTPFILAPGRYYFAYVNDGTTSRSAGTTSLTVEMLKLLGVLQQASDLALADPATFATPTQALYPYCGVTRTQSGF